MAPPRVAVVIVNTNEGTHLPRALEALRAQSRPVDRVVVVDNGSTDGSPAMIEEDHPEVDLLRLGRNAGHAAACNAGVRATDDCDWAVLLDADAFPEPRWLESLLRAAEAHPDCASFGSLLMSASAPDELDGAGDAYHVAGLAWRVGRGSKLEAVPLARTAHEVFSACAAAAMYRRDAYLAVGGFDESYFVYLDDIDLGFRLRLAGHRAWHVPEAVALHMGSATVGSESDLAIYHSHRNLVWTWVKNMPAGLVLMYLPAHVLANALGVLGYARQGRGGVVLRAKLDALRALPRVLRARREIQSRRAASAPALLAAMARGREGLEVFPNVRRVLERLP
jgi:GT2 family glycosyltransferase